MLLMLLSCTSRRSGFRPRAFSPFPEGAEQDGFRTKLLPAALLGALNTNVLVNVRAVFLNALKMMIAPLVFFSVTSSLGGMGDVSEIGRAGSRVLALYLITSLFACAVGTGLFCLFSAARYRRSHWS